MLKQFLCYDILKPILSGTVYIPWNRDAKGVPPLQLFPLSISTLSVQAHLQEVVGYLGACKYVDAKGQWVFGLI